MFQANNRMSEDCGPAPTVPEDAIYKSYFENNHGEQWLFWKDEDGELHLRGGDCDWRTILEPFCVALPVVDEVFQALEAPFMAQFLLAGCVTISPILGLTDHVPTMTFVRADTSEVFALNTSERIWLDACLEGSRTELTPLTAEEFSACVHTFMTTDEDEDGEAED